MALQPAEKTPERDGPLPGPSREAAIISAWKLEQFGNRGLDVTLFNHITQACDDLVRRLEKKE